MNKWIYIGMLWSTVTASHAAVPNQITYQGTLKEGGVPVTGVRTMQFRLTNVDGTAVYWSGGLTPVTVNQGLFSTILAPAGVNWQAISPYIEVSVQGQVLLPREPVTSTAYALTCGSISDGSVLSGMIAMFANACPAGWARFSAMDGLFPMGGGAYGVRGGSASHFHTTPNHQHALATAQSFNAGCYAGPVGVVNGGGPGLVGIPGGAYCGYRQVTVNTTSNGSGATDSVSNVPPYLTMVFCQKQ
ncbi:MAG: hypothetical protein A2992_02355 [Elusimicrobia bacterium RIFCSPLOWO2_01_FULL_59_12]|nr:MAG: hypothetical protein A2992_02355 [Elusimicrobia bacterium RIFCSPLOWO2_01_FULL_59_12]